MRRAGGRRRAGGEEATARRRRRREGGGGRRKGDDGGRRAGGGGRWGREGVGCGVGLPAMLGRSIVSTCTRESAYEGGSIHGQGGEGRTPAAYLRRAGGEEVLVVGVLSRAPAHEPDARTNAGGSPGATRVSHGGGGQLPIMVLRGSSRARLLLRAPEGRPTMGMSGAGQWDGSQACPEVLSTARNAKLSLGERNEQTCSSASAWTSTRSIAFVKRRSRRYLHARRARCECRARAARRQQAPRHSGSWQPWNRHIYQVNATFTR